ncbi:hypothetical protein MTO96_030311 [Rhipicephalus appendiculatus]
MSSNYSSITEEEQLTHLERQCTWSVSDANVATDVGATDAGGRTPLMRIVPLQRNTGTIPAAATARHRNVSPV